MRQNYLLSVVGNSGCSVELQQVAGRYVIKKSTSSLAYIPRLKKQIEIQQSFFKLSESEIFYVPEVISVVEKSDSFAAYMEYVPYSDFIDFFQYASCQSIQRVVDNLLGFINNNSSGSDVVVNDLIAAKVSQIQGSIADYNIISDFSPIFDCIGACLKTNRISVPSGQSHGDLTFSNMMFGDFSNRICLIDFLDSYIDSPYMDLVKLRQDSQFKWSLLKVLKPYDRVRINQVFDWIDSYVVDSFPIDKSIYFVLQSVNLLRILPYAKSLHEIDFIKNSILSLEC